MNEKSDRSARPDAGNQPPAGKGVEAAWRLAVGLLTIVPAGPVRADRTTAGHAMALAPLVGLCLGLMAGLVIEVAELLGLTASMTAILAIGAMALLTRLLHLDGLADTADGLGSGRSPAESLAVMKRSDIGPFGVVTVLLVVLVQVSALSSAIDDGHGAASLVVAAVAGRFVLPIACRSGVPPARSGGLGALVAGTVTTRWLLAAAAVALATAAGAALLSNLAIWRTVAAVVLAAAAGSFLLSWCVRRFGGITGDILGALTETATTIALLTLG
jgi:adenosylcobinamide-GDP ribazoletransferase